MAQATLVGNQIDDGEKLLKALVQAGFDVTAACWVKTGEEAPWYFYISSKDVETNGITPAYRKLHSVLRGSPELWVDPFEVKLIGQTHPITKDVLGLQPRHGSRLPLRYGGAQLGQVSIIEAFVYPPVTTP